MLIIDVYFHACDSMKQIVKKIPFPVCVWSITRGCFTWGAEYTFHALNSLESTFLVRLLNKKNAQAVEL
jgi:hypothetical protein